MRKLTKKWQIILYGISGFGVNLLNTIVGAYLCDALMVEGFSANVENWTYLNKTLVAAAVWSIMITVAKIVDGVIDIPIAGLSDNFRSRFGRRRLFILMGYIPMIICFLLFLLPIFSDPTTNGQLIGNSIWFGLILCGFYIAYTTVMGTYYATFSEIVGDDKSRMMLSNVKSACDIFYFVIGYALIPVLIGNLNIRTIALIMLPIALTMLIPFFLIKEKPNRLKDIEERKAKGEVEETEQVEEQASFGESLKYTFGNKTFWVWMIAFGLLQFGLQMFLAAQNVYYSGTMGLVGFKITIVMASAFAPAPFFLFLYNAIIKKFGFKVGYIYILVPFVISMVIMGIANKAIVTDETVRLILGCVASVFASASLGAFFSVGYAIPSQIAADETKKTGKSNPAMYFAVQGLVSGVVTAIATGVIWVNLKATGLSWTLPIFVAVSTIGSIIAAAFLPNYFNKIGQNKKENENLDK